MKFIIHHGCDVSIHVTRDIFDIHTYIHSILISLHVVQVVLETISSVFPQPALFSFVNYSPFFVGTGITKSSRQLAVCQSPQMISKFPINTNQRDRYICLQ